MDERTDGQDGTDGTVRMDGHTDGRKDRQMDGRTDGSDGRMRRDGRAGRADGRASQLYCYVYIYRYTMFNYVNVVYFDYVCILFYVYIFIRYERTVLHSGVMFTIDIRFDYMSVFYSLIFNICNIVGAIYTYTFRLSYL